MDPETRAVEGDPSDAESAAAVLSRGDTCRALLESSPDSLSIIESDGTIRYESAALQHLTGQRPEDVIGRSVLEFIHPDDQARVLSTIRDAVDAAAEVHVEEYRWRCADGSWRWFETRGRNFLGAPEIDGFLCVSRDVHERRLVEACLEESERFHRELLSSISDAVFLTTPSGELTFVCPNVHVIFGQDADTISELGNLGHVLGEGFLEHLEGEFEERRHIEWTVRDAAGEERALLVNVKSVQELRGSTRLVVVREVTDYRVAERARQESERRARELFERSVDGVYVTTTSGRFLDANQALADILGYRSREELLTASVPDHYVDPGQREELKARLRERGQVRGFPVAVKRADGTGVVHCEITAVLQRGDPEPTMMGIVRDVTERRAREERLRMLSETLEQAHDSVLITDPEGRIEYANAAFQRSHGRAPTEVLGQSVRTLRSDLHDDAFYERVWATIGSGESWQGTFQNRHPDGSVRDLETTITPIRDDDGAVVHYAALYRDATLERQLEEALGQARRMETVGRLAGGVAHHFNNLLTAIRGYAELLTREFDDGSQQREDLDGILEASRRAMTLTRQLTAFAQQPDAESDGVNLGDLAERTVSQFRSELPDGVTVDLRRAPGTDPVRGDVWQLSRVLDSLLVNARDAVGPEGHIEVRVEPIETSIDAPCPCGSGTAGRYVRLVVADDGCGMDEATRERAFEPFFSTKGDGRVAADGVGLGLTFAYAVVDALGGHVCIHSRPGEGTRVEVMLPPAEGPGPGR